MAERNLGKKSCFAFIGKVDRSSKFLYEKKRLSKSDKTMNEIRNKLEVKVRIIKLLSSNLTKKLYARIVFENKYAARIPYNFFLPEEFLSL